jgi:hypothetical protein
MDAAFDFWLSDGEQRSPFPEYMHEQLHDLTFRAFMERTLTLDRSAVTAELLGEQFGQVIREVGLQLARSDEDRLTILYPELPRAGDQLNATDEGQKVGGRILRRYLSGTEGDRQLRVVVRMDTGEEWETGFEVGASGISETGGG